MGMTDLEVSIASLFEVSLILIEHTLPFYDFVYVPDVLLIAVSNSASKVFSVCSWVAV
jgi:hypothetical protein